jgi:hypothetical protein
MNGMAPAHLYFVVLLPHAQRNAFRHRDARLQSRSFARWDPQLQHECRDNHAVDGKMMRRLHKIRANFDKKR